MALRPTLSGVAGGALVLVVAIVCVRLGIWQLDRLEERRARNAAYAAALAQPALVLAGDSLDAVRTNPEAFVYRRVRVPGEPDWEREIVWRGRSLGGRPGVNLLTPYLLPGGAVLVNRGWAPSDDAARVELEPLREGDAADPVGVLIPMAREAVPARPRMLELDRRSVLSVQLPAVEPVNDHVPGILPLYVQLLPAPGDPAVPTRLGIPDLSDEGPHLGYAVQWFGFAGIACIGFIAVLILRNRSRRA